MNGRNCIIFPFVDTHGSVIKISREIVAEDLNCFSPKKGFLFSFITSVQIESSSVTMMIFTLQSCKIKLHLNRTRNVSSFYWSSFYTAGISRTPNEFAFMWKLFVLFETTMCLFLFTTSAPTCFAQCLTDLLILVASSYVDPKVYKSL